MDNNSKKVVWRKYKSWSGCKISGTEKYTLKPDEVNEHMKRALWLTVQVEGGGRFGAINSYDGTGMSAGLEHRVALYPRTMKQGPLWRLIKKIEPEGHCEALEVLIEALWCEARWYISDDGTLRHRNTKNLVTGQEIRQMFTPPNGRVPKAGPEWEKAKEWALMFHELFSSEETFSAQVDSAIDNLVRGNSAVEVKLYKKTTGNVDYKKLFVNEGIDIENDLAWCVYHAFSVNAPSIARKCLEVCLDAPKEEFPKKIITTLGTTSYGRWHDTKTGTNRYDRTRKYAMNSNLWPLDLFKGSNAIMPENL